MKPGTGNMVRSDDCCGQRRITPLVVPALELESDRLISRRGLTFTFAQIKYANDVLVIVHVIMTMKMFSVAAAVCLFVYM
jgi:hypothetical protein